MDEKTFISWPATKPVYDGIHPRAVGYRFEPKYDIHPSASDLNEESLDEQEWVNGVIPMDVPGETLHEPVDKHRYCHCPSKRFDQHTGDDGCDKCGTVGAHDWITVCACCGTQQSQFEVPEYLEVD